MVGVGVGDGVGVEVEVWALGFGVRNVSPWVRFGLLR